VVGPNKSLHADGGRITVSQCSTSPERPPRRLSESFGGLGSQMLPPYELLVDGFADRDVSVQAVNNCSEAPWLKQSLLGVIFLDQPFAIRYDAETEAQEVASRIRDLGFRCKVWAGPDPSERVGGSNAR
jgi:hypothetical protein